MSRMLSLPRVSPWIQMPQNQFIRFRVLEICQECYGYRECRPRWKGRPRRPNRSKSRGTTARSIQIHHPQYNQQPWQSATTPSESKHKCSSRAAPSWSTRAAATTAESSSSSSSSHGLRLPLKSSYFSWWLAQYNLTRIKIWSSCETETTIPPISTIWE